MKLFADTLRPNSKLLGFSFDALLVLASSFLLALSAQVAMPLPFTPVPVSMQTFAVLLIGALIGAKRGVASVLAYLTQGALGFPVFAAGAAGFGALLGPRGGYLFAFLAAISLIGFFIQKIEQKTITKLFLSFLIADLTILVLGGLWLSFYVGATHAFSLGIAPFLLAELTKVTILTLAFVRLK